MRSEHNGFMHSISLLSISLLSVCLFGAVNLRGFAERRLSLREAVSLAVANSPSIEALIREEQRSELSFRERVRGYLPSLILSASAQDAVWTGAPDTRLKRLGLRLSQVIYDPSLYGRGSLRKTIEARTAQKGFAALLCEEAYRRAGLEALTSFVALLTAKRTGEIRREAIRASVIGREAALQELSLGIITPAEYAEAQIAVMDLELEDAEARSEERSALFGLKSGLGLSPEEDINVSGTLREDYTGFIPRPLSGETESRFTASALASNTQLVGKRLEAALQGAEPEEEPSMLPAIRATGEVFFQGYDPPLDELGFSISLSLAFPNPVLPLSGRISLGGNGRDRISRELSAEAEVLPRGNLGTMRKQKAWERASLIGEIARLEDEIIFSVREALAAVDTRRRAVAILREKIRVEEERLSLIRARASLGGARAIDILKAEIAVSTSREGLIEEVSALFAAEAGLCLLCGLDFDLARANELIEEEEHE